MGSGSRLVVVSAFQRHRSDEDRPVSTDAGARGSGGNGARLAALVPVLATLAGCGGASSGENATSAPAVGGGLADGPGFVNPPAPVPPGVPSAPSLLPGERFAVTNGTDQRIIYFA
ncbi:MAG: hypothetical protein JNM10_16055 [Planctomycetia bacterium]|nr:hypothetical protein [Planctomycetia bacterium]